MSKQEYKDKIKDLVKIVDGKEVLDKEEAKKIQGGKRLEKEGTRKEFLEMSVKVNVDRYTAFPDRLPANELPHPPDEHELIGMFESKRDLYLLLANAYNKVMEEIDAIKNQVGIV